MHTAHNRCMDTFTRWYLLVLIETIVTALTGTLLGPVIGGDFGYAWGYWSGWVGPMACVLLAGAALPLARLSRAI